MNKYHTYQNVLKTIQDYVKKNYQPIVMTSWKRLAVMFWSGIIATKTGLIYAQI